MATNKIYYTPGTPVTFQASGGTVVWTPQNEAASKGRISDVWDRGAGSLPARYRWRMQTRWAATVTALDSMRLYLVTSAASATPAVTDGGLTFGDAELAAETILSYQAQFLGAVIASVAMWNAAASKALTNTAGDHIMTLTPIPDDVQAAA